jgi:hypothetical protein
VRNLNPIHLVRPCPEFAEAIELLARTGRYFMLDGRPHVLIQKGTKLVCPGSGLANMLLFEEPEIGIVSPSGAPVSLNRTVVAEFTRRLEALLNNRPEIWPSLKSYVRGPMYRRTIGGKMVRVPEGYDPVSEQLVLTPVLPTLPPVAPGYPHLHALFSGLEFADQVYKANLLGVCVAMFCRTGIDEFPLLLVDATAKSSGKTTVLKALGALLNGAQDGAMTYSGSEEEFERRLGSYCGLPGPNLIPIDNIRVKKGAGYLIRSQTLASIVHSHVAKVRKLYSGPSLLFDAICVGTMNDARVERDLADKTVVLTLTRPPGPLNHRKILPYPPDYVRQWRMELLAEIFQVIERLALPPIEGADLHTRFYTFEQVVVEAARELGLDASFDPSRVRSVDAFLEQLLNLLYDALPELAAEGRVPVDRIVKAVECHPGFEELNDILRASPRAGKGKTSAFAEHLANTVSGKRYRWQGKVIGLTIDNDTLTLYTYS